MIRLTQPQIDAVCACVDICLADEWPFEDVRREVAERALRKLRDLIPTAGVILSRDDDRDA